jgi:hypothetical protein
MKEKSCGNLEDLDNLLYKSNNDEELTNYDSLFEQGDFDKDCFSAFEDIQYHVTNYRE